jgi:serine/threonine-protein kinase Stk1
MNDGETLDIKATVKELMIINKIPEIQMKDLSLKKKIGEGGQAKVYKGQYQNQPVAVKVLNNVDWKCLAHEIVIIANLNHPSIPKFFGIVNDDKVLALVFEYVEGKTLDEIPTGELSLEHKINIIKCVASVLNFLHSNQFIHRDLKPENIMIDDKFNVFVIDFGIAKVVTNSSFTITRAKGTLNYLAPECLIAEEVNEEEEILSVITPKVDVWAFGCIVSWLFSGIQPWTNLFKNDALIQQAQMTNVPFPIPVESIKIDTIVSIIQMATVVDYKERAEMGKLQEIIETL